MTVAARWTLVLLLPVLCMPALASIDVYEFDSLEKEARFHQLNAELRCPKCQNTNLAGSDAPIAQDLRATVARLVREGHSDQEVKGYMAERYGEFVLYKPRLNAQTVVLWAGPFALLLLGLGIIFWLVRAQRHRAPESEASGDDSHEQVEALRARLRADASGDQS